MTEHNMQNNSRHKHSRKDTMDPVEKFLWRCTVVLMVFILLCSLYFVWEFLYIFYIVFSALLAA